MKIAAFIPIKTNNERTPGKNTRKFFDGTPLMYFIQRTLLSIDRIHEVYVFCSDKSITEYCLPGVKYLSRPTSLDTAKATPSDIIHSFLGQVDADIYITAHATTPFVPAAAIKDCINAVAGGTYDSAFTASKIKKLLWDGNGRALNFDPSNVPRTQDLPPLYAEVGAAYVYRRGLFLETGRRIGNKPFIREVSEMEAVDIDYPEDFDLANAIYQYRKTRDEYERSN